jgi:His/Glu/Gln/Arg/opine family amino acid ABC transporter permease subunit
VIPPIGSVLIALVKNTSIAAAFSVTEATQVARRLSNTFGSATITILVGVALGYLAITTILSIGDPQHRLHAARTTDGRRVTATALYDAPGPRGRRRILVGGLISAVLVVAVLALVIRRLDETGQFRRIFWEPFTTPGVQRILWNGLLATLRAAGTALVLALVLGVLLAAARLSDRRWLRRSARVFVEVFRGLPLLLLVFFAFLGLPRAGIEIGPFGALVLALSVGGAEPRARQGRRAPPRPAPPGGADHAAVAREPDGRPREGHLARLHRGVRGAAAVGPAHLHEHRQRHPDRDRRRVDLHRDQPDPDRDRHGARATPAPHRARAGPGRPRRRTQVSRVA